MMKVLAVMTYFQISLPTHGGTAPKSQPRRLACDLSRLMRACRLPPARGMNHAGQTAQQGQHYVDEEMEAEAYLDKGADRGERWPAGS